MDEGINTQGNEEVSLDGQHTDYDGYADEVCRDSDNVLQEENQNVEEAENVNDEEGDDDNVEDPEDANVEEDANENDEEDANEDGVVDENENVQEDETENEEEEDIDEDVRSNLSGVDFFSITADEVKGVEFADVESAYAFYNEYAKVKGFGVRKNKRGKNKNDQITWKQFVCSSQGFRDSKYMNLPNRQREHRVLTRFGCEAEIRISFAASNGRWFVSWFEDEHNHQLLGDKFFGLLRSHRKMSAADVAQLDSMWKSGISIPKIFGSFASQSDGYDKIGFGKKDMYNCVQKEKNMQESDVKEAAKFLKELRSKDPTLFWSHKAAVDGRLLHLFWCDGTSQCDYEVFGEVLAFDATYGRNNYKCPVVVFSGVNHHKKTCVFGCAIVSDEKEETYVWVLSQFLDAMKGKAPSCVITDGDLSMRNAIGVVFPEAHHRLCGWHLIRNVTANVGDIRFTQMFKNCMLSNYDISEFEERWTAAVEECGLVDNGWVQQLYGKKLMWSTAHIRGKFFAGMRTTSRCEALHAHMGKYIQSRFNLREFLFHFQRCLEYIRSKEIGADFKSAYGVPVMQTELILLEQHGAEVYTREIFYVFRKRLFSSLGMNVLDCLQAASAKIFIVGKYCRPNLRWHVSFYPSEMEARFSCQGMESDGIPCVHLIRVLVLLDFDHIPSCLVLPRWTKSAKKEAEGRHFPGHMGGNNALYNGRYTALIDSCRRLCTYASRNYEDFTDIREKVLYETEQLQTKHREACSQQGREGVDRGTCYLREPVAFRNQSCMGAPSGSGQRGKKKPKCSCCRAEGHTRKTCPHAARIGQILTSDPGNVSSMA